MKLPLILSFVFIGCIPKTYIVETSPEPCKVVCMRLSFACNTLEEGSPEKRSMVCYKKEQRCFDSCDKDDIK